MNLAPLKAVLADLERDLESAREARYQIEDKHFPSEREVPYIYHDARTALPAFLNAIYETLAVALEAAGLPLTRLRLIKTWASFEKQGGIGNTRYDEEFDYLESKPFEYLEQLVKNVRLIASEGLDAHGAYELAQLERILQRTAVLVRRRRLQPTKEKEIRDVMHDYLGAFFTEYKTKLVIPGILKDFKPDGGVRNLKAAIEFKFADSPQEVTRHIGGIFEDTAGYNGSLDWTRFYTVIYQTEAFESEDRVRSEHAELY